MDKDLKTNDIALRQNWHLCPNLSAVDIGLLNKFVSWSMEEVNEDLFGNHFLKYKRV